MGSKRKDEGTTRNSTKKFYPINSSSHLPIYSTTGLSSDFPRRSIIGGKLQMKSLLKTGSLILGLIFLFSTMLHAETETVNKEQNPFFKDIGLVRENPSKEKKNYKEGEILVRFKKGTSKSKVKNLNKKLQMQIIQKLSFRDFSIHQIKLPPTVTLEEAIKEYESDPAVKYAVPNYRVYPSKIKSSSKEIPNDEYFIYLWGLNNTGQTSGTVNADINAPEAWNTNTGNKNIVIAVVDTGIQIDHEDLRENIWVNKEEYNGKPGVDDDGNGYIDDVYGWDFYNNDNTVYDGKTIHGTHTAGTIGAVGNNKIGISGVNWRVKIMPLKFMEEDGYLSNAIKAFEYATNKGVKIICNSWGRSGAPNEAMEDAIKNSKALCIFAAGNDGMNNDDNYPDDTHYPSSYALNNIIAVAASDDNDQLAEFSNYGEKTVDLAAPGVHILSSIPMDSNGFSKGYGFMSGTSMSTAYTAGVAGLIMAANPYEDILEIKKKILNNVDKFQSLIAKTSTGGRLDAYTSQPPSQISSSLKISNLLNVPNPFSQSTYFTYELSKKAQIDINIYNIAGQRVRTIEDASGEIGLNKTFWDGVTDTGTTLPNGVYIYQITAKTEDEISKKTGKAAALK